MSYQNCKKRPLAAQRAYSYVLALALVVLEMLQGVYAVTGPDETQTPSPDSVETTDQKFQEFVDLLVRASLKKASPPSITDIGELAHLPNNASLVETSAAVRANLDLVLENVSKKEFEDLLAFLYQNNDTATIQLITDGLKKVKDPVALSRNYFLLAKYYESRKNWRGVQAALSKVNLRELSVGDNHYYNLLMGFALQNLKQHRKALKFYEEIPQTSPYFSHVKLNEGTAFLRQGWWTEAHIEFEKAIEALGRSGKDAGLRDRILVVLGYSQLNYEFYRDARETFRKVALGSPSMNKALMGIGLAAAYQKDFSGAANAFALLAEKSPSDLSVDEAYLLLPSAQAEAGDGAAAAAAYQNAIHHYERQIAELRSLQGKLGAAGSDGLLQHIQEMNGKAAEIYGSQESVPLFLLDNYQNLLSMRATSVALGQMSQFSAVNDHYQAILQELVRNNIEARITILNSYLSQAKFGMAQLYDKP